MTIILWRRFTVGRSTQTPLKYIFSESLIILDYDSIFTKVKKNSGFPNIARYFSKYRGSQIKFVSGRIWAGERD